MKCLLIILGVFVSNISGRQYGFAQLYDNALSLDNIPSVADKNEVVRVDFYYESLCPGCRQFDSHDLKNAIQLIGSYLDLHPYPYGNAKTKTENGKITITCQHGEAECYGNKLHACAIDILKNVTKAVLFNACMMDDQRQDHGSDDQAADECGKAMSIDSEPIKQCAKSQRGSDLLYQYGEESHKTSYNYVPYVMINGEVMDYHNDFMESVCQAFKSPPPGCVSLLLQP